MIYTFMGEHPFLTFCLAAMLANLLVWPFRILNRIIRHMNIKAAGWPPSYLDADGDFKEKEDDDA